MTRHVILFLLLAGLCLPASAYDITGAWSFRTDIKRKGCEITGNMSIQPADEDGIRTCSFVSREVCGGDPDLSWQIEQSCRITPQAGRFLIRSEVIASLTEGYSGASYLPDHFNVRPESQTRMNGLWQDKMFSAPVLFWRDDNTPVS